MPFENISRWKRKEGRDKRPEIVWNECIDDCSWEPGKWQSIIKRRENKQYVFAALLLSEHQNICTERCERIYYLHDKMWWINERDFGHMKMIHQNNTKKLMRDVVASPTMNSISVCHRLNRIFRLPSAEWNKKRSICMRKHWNIRRDNATNRILM